MVLFGWAPMDRMIMFENPGKFRKQAYEYYFWIFYFVSNVCLVNIVQTFFIDIIMVGMAEYQVVKDVSNGKDGEVVSDDSAHGGGGGTRDLLLADAGKINTRKKFLINAPDGGTEKISRLSIRGSIDVGIPALSRRKRSEKGLKKIGRLSMCVETESPKESGHGRKSSQQKETELGILRPGDGGQGRGSQGSDEPLNLPVGYEEGIEIETSKIPGDTRPRFASDELIIPGQGNSQPKPGFGGGGFGGSGEFGSGHTHSLADYEKMGQSGGLGAFGERPENTGAFGAGHGHGAQKRDSILTPIKLYEDTGKQHMKKLVKRQAGQDSDDES